MDVELRQLRHFLVVAEELNFTRAATRLHVDQPALSRQIRRLESALGVQLFTRTSRRVELTAAGHHLRDRAPAVLADLDGVLAEVRRAAAGRAARLRLGWLIPLRDQLMTRLVRTFQASSGAGVDLVRHDFTDPSAGLASRAVDAAVVNPPLSTPGLSYAPLLREPRVLIVADSHPLARRPDVTLAELDRLDALWAVPPGDDRVWQDYWATADLPGRSLPPRRIEYRDNQDYLQAVATGQVLGMTITGAVGEALADFGIAAVPVRDLSPATLALAWHTADPNPLLPILAASARDIATLS
jgi:DNA-binding transcriptional LysR family regulator